MNARHQAALATTADRVVELRHDIARQLVELVEVEHRLAALLDERGRRGGPGIVTDEIREIRNRQHRLDRAAALGLHPDRDDVGLDFLNGSGSLASGQTDAPLDVAAVSVSAEIRFALLQHLRRLIRPATLSALEAETHHAAVTGWCVWPRHRLLARALETDAPTPKLAARLWGVVRGYQDRKGLEGILRDLERLEAAARDILDGPAKTRHPDPCPWCGRESLVIYHRLNGQPVQVIRCEAAGPCECSWEWCPCHRAPTRHHHEWINSGRAAHTWHQLHNLQTARKEALMIETRATDALAKIRELHQPIDIPIMGEVCQTCAGAVWPCATAQLADLDAQLEETSPTPTGDQPT